jgi:hypothetical protein
MEIIPALKLRSAMPTLKELLAGLSYNELVVFYDRLMRAASELTPDAQAPSAGSLPKPAKPEPNRIR